MLTSRAKLRYPLLFFLGFLLQWREGDFREMRDAIKRRIERARREVKALRGRNSAIRLIVIQ
jgi:hypothetical protein